jgi:hypothetical protein
MCFWLKGIDQAFVTNPERMQEVQTLSLTLRPSLTVLTF